MEKLITIDDLASICGHYHFDEKRDHENNGYHCSHDESEEDCCRRKQCPIASPATIDDLKKLDYILYGNYKNDADEDGRIDSDWMVQHSE